jgi:small subunit ribosomal protein S19e
MVAVQEVEARKLVAKLKEELKAVESIKPPEWIAFAKSGSGRERPPIQKDFWYIRSASVLRRIYLNGPIGVEKLKTFYGSRKRRGTKPARFRKASGSILRKILQQLEAAGFVEKLDKKGVKGRKISATGKKFLDKAAYEVSKV